MKRLSLAHITSLLDKLAYSSMLSTPVLSGTDTIPNTAYRIGLVVTSWNRPEFLGRSLKSLAQSDLSDCLIVIVDDGSNTETREIVLNPNISTCVISLCKKNQSGVSVSLNIGWSLLEACGCSLLANLDSDTLVKPDWLQSLRALHRDLPFSKDKLIVSGFNRHNRPSIVSEHNGYALKSAMGGINYLFDKSAWPLIQPFLKFKYWDTKLQEHFYRHKTEGYALVAHTPSVVQHTGFSGLNSDGGFDYAIDFDPVDIRFSCLIIYRHERDNCLDALHFILSQYSSQPGIELILIEQGIQSIVDFRAHPECRYQLVTDPLVSSRGQLLSIAAKLSHGRGLVVHKANVITNIENLNHAMAILESGVDFVQPCSALVDLSNDETNKVLGGEKSLIIHQGEPHRVKTEAAIDPLNSGIFLIQRTAFRQLTDQAMQKGNGKIQNQHLNELILQKCDYTYTIINGVGYRLNHPTQKTLGKNNPA